MNGTKSKKRHPKQMDLSPAKIKNVSWENIDESPLQEKHFFLGTPHPKTKKIKISANANSTPISLYAAYDSDEDVSYVPEIPNKKRKRSKKNTNWVVTDCSGVKPDKNNRPIGDKPKLKKIKKGRVVNTRNGSYIFDEDTFTSNQIAEQIFKNMIKDELESDSEESVEFENSVDSESPDELIPIEGDNQENDSSPTILFESSSDESDYNLDVMFNPPEIKLDGKKCQIIEPKVPISPENKVNSEKVAKIQSKKPEINILEKVEYFISNNNDTCIIVLKHPFKLYFNGKLSLIVLSGKLEILGHILEFNEEKQHDIYNPRGQSFLCLETLPSKRNPNISNILKKYLDEGVINTLNNNNNNCIVALKNLTNKMSDYLIKHTAQHLYPSTIQLNERPLMKLENKLNCLFEAESASLKLYKKHKYWMNITNKCLNQAKEMNSRSVICGGKNVGKSTLLRYMLNNMLNQVNEIVYIDLDPGQSEFTISGCVSVTVIDQPIFGPNYTHLKAPQKSFFIGDVNVTSVLDRYIASVKELLDYCEKNLNKNLPWVINCMGFSKSIGTDIIVLIIKLTKPSIVVQLESAKKNKNFSSHLTREFVDNFVPSFPIEIPNNELTYSLEILESVAEDIVSGEWISEPRLLREMCILTYFSQMLRDDKTEITGAVPYGVKLSSIKLHNINYSKKHILATLNGNLVALCESNAEVIATNTPLPCYGFGIVRGIDKQSDELYLLTPIKENLLDNVNLLVRGNIALPPSIFMTTGHQGLVPYIQLGTLQGTSAIPKRSFISWKVLLNKK